MSTRNSEFLGADDAVNTDSPIKKWWLTMFKGYRVTSVRKAPQSGYFGRILYRKQWILELGSKEERGREKQ